jgi:hypothetical protein
MFASLACENTDDGFRCVIVVSDKEYNLIETIHCDEDTFPTKRLLDLFSGESPVTHHRPKFVDEGYTPPVVEWISTANEWCMFRNCIDILNIDTTVFHDIDTTLDVILTVLKLERGSLPRESMYNILFEVDASINQTLETYAVNRVAAYHNIIDGMFALVHKQSLEKN